MTDAKRRRGPSTARKLKDALESVKQREADLAEVNALLFKARDDLKRAETTRDRNHQEAREREAEIEQVHSLLDALPDSVARKVPSPNGYGEQEVRLMTRLAAWLATRK